MPRKTLRSPALAQVRHDRQERREEITERWNRRAANRACEKQLAPLGNKYTWEDNEPYVVSTLLGYNSDAPLEDLIEYVDPGALKAILRYTLRTIQIKEMEYDDYLQTPEWKTIAATTKKRYQNRCALDASHPAEHAHHRTYKRRGREFPDDLIPLCADCHAKFHGKYR